MFIRIKRIGDFHLLNWSDVIQDEEGRVRDVSIFTAAKRSSFLVGSNENSYTAKNSFYQFFRRKRNQHLKILRRPLV